ncbi:hypothetical protein HHK36_010135 [Tetracentron sinense]|uniref:GATA-type domain-containing protein n=1 Tax=Tetracentron sinense TaxID=13715 RepID=A0A834ZC19_TETSI|nr:hypothetical protein HHK36_010135 [Tetracentron sinense]
MHRCSSSQGNTVGQCSCGMFQTQGNSFSMLFSMPNHNPFDEAHLYPSSVDCTLSLGTPSTRMSDDKSTSHQSGSCMSNLCWDILQTKQASPSPVMANKSSRGGASSNNSLAGDPLLARRCANCDTTSTPLWRNGPRGPKSLCNACGIRYKKEERRATTTAIMEPQQVSHHHHNNSWMHNAQTQKRSSMSPALSNEFRFIGDDDGDTSTGIPFLSWRLNVPDRTSLVHDFT